MRKETNEKSKETLMILLFLLLFLFLLAVVIFRLIVLPSIIIGDDYQSLDDFCKGHGYDGILQEEGMYCYRVINDTLTKEKEIIYLDGNIYFKQEGGFEE